MILWVKRTAALLNGVFLIVLLSAIGKDGLAVIAGIANLIWALADIIPKPFPRFLSSGVLILNTGLALFGVISGGPAAWAVLASAGSLLSWNVGLFKDRWGDSARSMQTRYLNRLGGVTALGLSAGLSALALQGKFSPPFLWAFLSMVVGGILLLRLMSRASRERD